uniref:Ig-like domain-containing protein n=1 Tax=Maylandia zebra TaxID=106582 RepID=A0A3P9CCV2_9CICH
PSAEIVEGSSVALTCSSDANPAASYTWYKEDGQTPLSKEWWLSFSSIQPSDSGQYYCTAENDLGKRTSESIFIDVKYAPKPPSVSVRPSGEIKEGTSVTLTCSSEANPAATYVWYKINGRTPLSKERQLFFSSIQPSDSGQYYCIAANTVGSRTSEYVSINVKYAPKFVSVMVSPSNEFREGGSLTLTCSSDANPAAQYSWYKKNGQKPLSNEQQLSFSSIQPSDSGEYYCTAQNKVGRKKSEYTSIDVKYAPKPPSVSVSPSGEITEGTAVTLTCSSDANPAATYVWYKKNSQPLSKNPQLIFSSIQSSDSGQYYCRAVNKLGSNTQLQMFFPPDAPKLPSVSVSPSADIVEGSSVTLTCSSDANPAANYTWYKEDEDSPKASGQNFTITDITPEHSGSYSCVAQNNRGHHYSTLQLTASSNSCDVIDPPSYVWYKNGQKIEEETSLRVSVGGDDSSYSLCEFTPQCHYEMSCNIFSSPPDVPKLPSVSGGSVTLTCSSDANPAAQYSWYKKNGQKPLSSEQQLSFSSIQPSDSGEYYCTAQNKVGRKKSEYTSIDVKCGLSLSKHLGTFIGDYLSQTFVKEVPSFNDTLQLSVHSGK